MLPLESLRLAKSEIQTFATRKILTGAIKMVHDGVQKGVLWGEEALHHRHLGLCG